MFDVVERVLVDGDEGVRNIVTYGLIESLQNLASDRSGWAPAGRFRQWLRPATLRAWDEVHTYRGTSDPGAGWPPSGVIGEHLATGTPCHLRNRIHATDVGSQNEVGVGHHGDRTGWTWRDRARWPHRVVRLDRGADRGSEKPDPNADDRLAD